MRIVFLANGHGEDMIGSRLARQLAGLLPEAELAAFPLVGRGEAWRAAGVQVLGQARDLPSGGLTFHSVSNLIQDVQAGLLSATWRQFADLRAVKADALVVTGDIWATALSLLPRVPASRRFVVQTLVSVRQQGLRPPSLTRLFMERITAPERLLQRHFTARVWLRDGETAAWLQERSVKQASYAGSLIQDRLSAGAQASGPARVLLLPGSRSWARESLELLLPLAIRLPGVRFQVAWARPELPTGLAGDWQLLGTDPQALVSGSTTVEFHRHAFDALLSGASAAVGTAGTAAEQVAAAGLPMLSFELKGRHTAGFLRNQQRILGGALHVADSSSPAELAGSLKHLLEDDGARQAARESGSRVLGTPGGLHNIAAAIHDQLLRD